MNYFVVRGSEEFGPYSLGDLRRYVEAGSIALTDRARSEGMQEAVPVQQIIGNIPASPENRNPPGSIDYGTVPVYGAATQPLDSAAAPLPPGLHWGLVLFFGVITFGVFLWVWMFVQASFVRRLRPSSRAILWYALGVGFLLVGSFGLGMLESTAPGARNLEGFVQLVSVVLMQIGHFNLKSSLEEYYRDIPHTNLQLSGAMTFLFNTIYFQYHFNQIRRAQLGQA